MKRLDRQPEFPSGLDHLRDVGMQRRVAHPTSLSIAAANVRSLSVTVEPAECVVSEMSTVFHEFDQSGWCPCASARSATRVMNPNASEKFLNTKRRRSAPPSSAHALSAA